MRKLLAIAWTASLLVFCLMVWAYGNPGFATLASAASIEAPANIVNDSRNIPPTGDFLRLFFLKPTDPDPTTTGRTGAYRAFFGDTEFYEPPIHLTDILGYSGIPYVPGQDLVALRCIPSAASGAEPMLATWPNMFKAMNEDFAANPPQGAYEAALADIADSFAEVESIAASKTLANALAFGAAVFADADNPGCTTNSRVNCPQTSAMTFRFGAFPPFSGLGLAIANTQTSPSQDSREVLRQAVIPEYILRSVSLADAGCRCIRVPDYPGRQNARFKPRQVLRRGAFGACNMIRHL